MLARFGRGTAVYRLIETLGPATDLADLDTLATIPADSAKTLDRLEGEIAALRSNSLDALLTAAEEHERQLNRLHGVLVSAQAFDEEAYEVARAALRDAEERRTKAREQLFTAGELPGPPDENWQAFVVAGDTYRGHLGRDDYPTSADSCLYCMQDLGAEAFDLLTRYRIFLDETLVRHVTGTAAARDRARLSLADNELTRALEFASRQAERDDPPAWATEAFAGLDAAQIVVQATRSGEEVPRAGLREKAQAAASAVAEALAATTTTISQLASDKADAAQALAARRSEHTELAARIELKRNLHVARDYVQRAKRAQQLDKLSHGISNGPAKQLTLQAKLASEDLVNKNFESLFADECERLRAPQVVLRFQGRSGQSQRKKVVATYKPSSVLSEGEQKVLALADFLAESRMRGIRAPLVFDDPVTSLDYRRLDEVATRIQVLAETHQVIVFTHNIMFASALISARQSKTLRVKFYEVRDGGEFKGILAPDVEPRLDNPAELAKKINVKLQAIPGTEPVVQDALIKETYDLIRAWCEAFVEQELLQNVTQRFRSNIMMTRLTKIDSTRLDAAIAVIDPLFARACERMTGHSHAGEYLSTKPTVADLQEDWDKAKAARAAYLAN